MKQLTHKYSSAVQFLDVVALAIAFGCFAVVSVKGVTPAPDGSYPNFTTAEGLNALNNLTTGAGNTGVGCYSLFGVIAGSYNTAVGAGTLALNTGDQNTATGVAALLLNHTAISNTAAGFSALLNNDSTGNGLGAYNSAFGASAMLNNTDGDENAAFGESTMYQNTTGNFNTGIGDSALFHNQTGDGNTAVGRHALLNNTTDNNTAVGNQALFANTTGDSNTAVGFNALSSNTTPGGLAANTAVGSQALLSNTTGGDNVALGLLALVNNSTGSSNTAIGAAAGAQITADNNIDIGAAVAGVAGESNTTRVGNSNVTDTYITGIFFAQQGNQGGPVYCDADGKLYTLGSSKRFKEDIKAMDNASEALLALKPVTFRYKKDIEPTGTTQFGLVAEEVEKVNRDLVVRDKAGKTYSVRYDQINAMLLNEFLKPHRKVEEQQSQIANQETTIGKLKENIDALTRQLAKQATQIEEVGAQLELSNPAHRTVLNGADPDQ